VDSRHSVVVNEDPGEAVCGPVVPSRTIIPKPGTFSPTEYADNGRTGPKQKRKKENEWTFSCEIPQESPSS
jgi:hypothetical protein